MFVLPIWTVYNAVAARLNRNAPARFVTSEPWSFHIIYPVLQGTLCNRLQKGYGLALTVHMTNRSTNLDKASLGQTYITVIRLTRCPIAGSQRILIIIMHGKFKLCLNDFRLGYSTHWVSQTVVLVARTCGPRRQPFEHAVNKREDTRGERFDGFHHQAIHRREALSWLSEVFPKDVATCAICSPLAHKGCICGISIPK